MSLNIFNFKSFIIYINYEVKKIFKKIVFKKKDNSLININIKDIII